jgi:hypothetical protein
MAPRAAFLLFACLTAASGVLAARPAVAEEKANSTALIDTKKHKQKGFFSYCSGWCFKCTDTGTEWKVNRGTSTSSKLAKIALVAGGVALIAMTGGMAGAAGAMFMGGVAAMGAGSSLVIGAGALGAAQLLTTTEQRMCPEVSFDEKLTKNSGLIASTKHNFLSLFGKSQHKEETFKLIDVDYMELLLHVHKDDGTDLMKGDRSEMEETPRLQSALACNYMTFDDKTWLQKKQEQTNSVLSDAKADEYKAGIVEDCGRWLCAGPADNARKTGITSKCGGRTNIIKALWR